ncbi:MAG: hypothetical protein JW863_18255 [Chitinispirillaceae bacterium]|nr:hypothetical protein [Chitinispirillaceae bacterium]
MSGIRRGTITLTKREVMAVLFIVRSYTVKPCLLVHGEYLCTALLLPMLPVSA